MDWHTLRHKIFKDHTLQMDSKEIGILLVDLYDMLEDLEKRIEKLEDKLDAKTSN